MPFILRIRDFVKIMGREYWKSHTIFSVLPNAASKNAKIKGSQNYEFYSSVLARC